MAVARIYTGSADGADQSAGAASSENAKRHSNVFPELDHNEIMSWQALAELRRWRSWS
jgi:hypothetical protein